MDIFKFPLARVTICFVFGIAAATQFAIPSIVVWTSTAVLLLLLTATYLIARQHFVQRIYFGICISLTAFAIGMLAHYSHANADLSTRFTTQISAQDSVYDLQIILRERLKNTAKNYRFVGCVTKLGDSASSGKILISVRRDQTALPLVVGSVIRTSATIYEHKPPTNPGQFDYGKYLQNKRIYAQLYVNANQIQTAETERKDIWFYSDRLRSTILNNLSKSNFPQSELSVLAALILGQQQDISKQTLQDYQYAGAVHILSVSGLHVGFIVLFLNFVLRPLPKTIAASYIRIAIVIICLWGFALIAGFSPSVVRSVTMFSFVAVGMHLKRETNIYHTLLVSLLLILLIEPTFLFDVGFQLSYTALFFILWLQPMLSSLWKPKYKVVEYFWNIFTVSVAAQIGAFPLSVYYFHQFPGLFFVTNLAIIPFISIIMALGVVTMIVASFTLVPDLLVTVLKTAIWGLNTIVNRIASIEDFVFRDIPFNMQLLIVCYIAITIIVLSLKQPGYVRFMLALIAVLTTQLIYIGNRWKSHAEKELVIFDVRKGSLIAERKDGTAEVYCDDLINETTLQSYLTAHFTTELSRQPLRNLHYFEELKIAIVDSTAILPEIHPDVLLLRQSPRINLERILHRHRPKVIVADGSNYRSYVERWKQTCIKEKIPFHYTGEKGFYSIR